MGTSNENHLFSFYFNSYRSFIAQANMNVPKTSNADSIPFALYNKSQQSPYRMWTNSQTHVYNYGLSGGITFSNAGYTTNINTTYSKLRKSSSEDGLEDGFNTPQWIYNVSVGNASLFKSFFGFNINYRWQSSFLWQSSLATGTVAAFGTLDAQVQYSFPENRLNLKLGASNLFNKYNYSFIGGPAIGGLYYCTATIHVF